MSKTRRKLVPGLLTEDRLKDLRVGMVLRIHTRCAGNDKRWSYIDICMSAVGIIPNGKGHYSEAFTAVRDEELGLRYCGE